MSDVEVEALVEFIVGVGVGVLATVGVGTSIGTGVSVGGGSLVITTILFEPTPRIEWSHA